MQRMAQQATAGQHQQQAALLLNNINLVAKLIERVQENSVQISSQVQSQHHQQQLLQQQQQPSLLQLSAGSLSLCQDQHLQQQQQQQQAHRFHELGNDLDDDQLGREDEDEDQDIIDERDFELEREQRHLCERARPDDDASRESELGRLSQVGDDEDEDSQLEVDDHEKPFYLVAQDQQLQVAGQQEILVTSGTEGPFRLKGSASTSAGPTSTSSISGGAKKSSKKKMAKQRRLYKCRHCGFSTDKKVENWQHIRIHMRPEKLLACDACQFVTEYKHHLEYHQRNHSGYKPFKCEHCDYQCVNKSMLNSHMKSHSSVYQYQCGDCKYATKYVHSLKMHLRKYNHQPAQLMIDVYGRKRGPKSTSSSSSGGSTTINNNNNNNNSSKNNISNNNRQPHRADQSPTGSQQQDQQCSILDLRVDSKLVR